MQAWTFTGPPFPTTLELVTLPESTAPLQPFQVVIQVEAAGLNPVDVQLANLPIFKLAALSYLKGIGSDYAGKIIAKGSGVTRFKVGDEVLGCSLAAVCSPLLLLHFQLSVSDHFTMCINSSVNPSHDH